MLKCSSWIFDNKSQREKGVFTLELILTLSQWTLPTSKNEQANRKIRTKISGTKAWVTGFSNGRILLNLTKQATLQSKLSTKPYLIAATAAEETAASAINETG